MPSIPPQNGVSPKHQKKLKLNISVVPCPNLKLQQSPSVDCLQGYVLSCVSALLTGLTAYKIHVEVEIGGVKAAHPALISSIVSEPEFQC